MFYKLHEQIVNIVLKYNNKTLAIIKPLETQEATLENAEKRIQESG